MCVYMGERVKGNLVIRSCHSRIRRHVPLRRLYVTEVIYELCLVSRSVCVAAQEASSMWVFDPIYTLLFDLYH